MLEQETAHIIAEVFGSTLGDRQSITLRDVLAADIPRGIKAYLRADILHGLREDLERAPTFAAVDKSLPTTRRMFRALVNGIAESFTFTRDGYRSRLGNAVHFLGNYLCRPQWTLESLVFGDAERISAAAMRERFEYVAEYGYFHLLIDKIIRQRGWTEVRRDDFRQLIALVDDRVVKEHNPRELALLAKPLYDFLLLRDSPPDARIPLKPVLVFFEDKKMRILRDYIEDICRIREREEITLDELTALVEDLYLGRSDDPPEAPSADPAQEAPAFLDPAKTSPIEFPPQEGRTELLEGEPDDFGLLPRVPPSEQTPEEDTGTFAGPAAGPVEPLTPAEQAPDAGRKNLALSLTYSGITEDPPRRDLPTLRSRISDHDRGVFVRRIFDKNEEAYEHVIDMLEAAPAWKDATRILNDLYRSHSLDPFDADVVTFTDSVHRRYTDPE
jgi:hypothetical protein